MHVTNRTSYALVPPEGELTTSTAKWSRQALPLVPYPSTPDCLLWLSWLLPWLPAVLSTVREADCAAVVFSSVGGKQNSFLEP